jgi:transposase
MLRSNLNQQNTYELICIEELVPSDHLLRKIDQHIDFSFITDKVRSYYCETNGRPAIVPILLFKMLFIGYLFGVRSERRLEKEIQMNIAYRWFLGLGLRAKSSLGSNSSYSEFLRTCSNTLCFFGSASGNSTFKISNSCSHW